MQLKEFNIMLDIKKHRKNEEIEIVQGDFDTNIINITLYDGLNVYSLDGLNIEIAFAKSDGTTVLQGAQDEVNPIAIAGNKIICTLKTNTIAAPGKVLAEVRILDGDRLLTSTRFEFYVRKAIVNDETIESTNEFPALQQMIKDVEVIKPLIPRIENLDLDLLENYADDLNQHKLDYAQQRSRDQLKVAKVEKELNDYQATMETMNPNQEAKQKATGYGIVSLPKNTANGQVGTRLLGRSLKNELNYNRDTWVEWINKVNVITDNSGAEFIMMDGQYSVMYLPTNLKPSTKYGILVNVLKNELGSTKQLYIDTSIFPSINYITSIGVTGNKKIIATSKDTISTNRLYIQTNNSSVDNGKKAKIVDIRIFELPLGSEIENDFNNLSADQLAQKYPYIKGDGTKSTIGAMRLKSIGNNLFNSELELGMLDVSTGRPTIDNTRIRTKNFIKVEPNKTYTLTNDKFYVASYYFYDNDKNFISWNATLPFTTPSNCYYIKINITGRIN